MMAPKLRTNIDMTIYGEIEDHQFINGIMRTSLSNRRKRILDIEAADLKETESAALEQLRSSSADGRLLGWKYIPHETASSPIISYATGFPFSAKYSQAWSATGRLQWHRRI